MSKPVKQMLRRELAQRFEGLDSLAILSLTGVDANTNREIRARLRDKDIRVTVVKNTVARQAFGDVGLSSASEILDGPCAVAYATSAEVSVVNVVRELLDIHKEAPNLTVKGAVLEGDVFGPERVEELSNYPTLDEAVSRIAGAALSAGANVAGALLGPGSRIAGAVKSIEEGGEGEQAEAA